MKSTEIRKIFLNYFEKRGHRIFGSASLVPENDPTLLFTVAGMVQFKPMFAGLVNFDFKSAASVQKCLRVGDLEEVGKSPFHDTFFEMLGNFSFNDYFQREAIAYAWEFLTDKMDLDKNRLYITVHKDDKRAFEIWKDDIGIGTDRIIRMGDDTNFWGPAGGTGACGPSSEIFYDFGNGLEDVSPCTIENDCMRYREIWNLVFPQFNQDSEGTRHPLKNRGIDTGMGMERLAAALQNKQTIYETDLFAPIIDEFLSMYDVDRVANNNALNSIADHIRALTFAIADGVIPENDGRGYVIRRILRRAVRLAYRMGIEEPFLYKLSSSVVNIMNDAYPYLESQSMKVSSVIKSEEERFLSNIGQGISLYNQYIEKHSSDTLDAQIIFKLYDTFGFPPDLTAQMAYEDNLTPDIKGFENLLEQAREQSRQNSAFNAGQATEWNVVKEDVSKFTGYDKHKDNARVLMHREREDKLEIIFNKTPFYAMSGGQVGDRGIATGSRGTVIDIEDTIKSDLGNIMIGTVSKGIFDPDDTYELEIDMMRRQLTERNHTATHMLHAALRSVLGEHVHQEGSYVGPDKMRFDFTHFASISDEELAAIEEKVNDIIFQSVDMHMEIMDYDEAVKRGAMALFTEKYDKQVRVVSIENFSTELCGGTHVHNTSEIGIFRITGESSIAAGIRRIEAVTSRAMYESASKAFSMIDSIKSILNVRNDDELERKIIQLVDENKSINKQLKEFNKASTGNILDHVLEQVKAFEQSHYIALILDEGNVKQQQLRELMDELKSRYKSISGFIGVHDKNKINIILFSSNTPFNANKGIKAITAITGGKGGGRPDMAMGSINKPGNEAEFLHTVSQLLKNE